MSQRAHDPKYYLRMQFTVNKQQEQENFMKLDHISNTDSHLTPVNSL